MHEALTVEQEPTIVLPLRQQGERLLSLIGIVSAHGAPDFLEVGHVLVDVHVVRENDIVPYFDPDGGCYELL